MNVLVVGGTGLLGQHTARAVLARGHEVTLSARHARPALLSGLGRAHFAELDVDTVRGERLVDHFRGQDSVVYALGPDDRTPHPAPSPDFFRVHLVERTARIAAAAREAGVRRFVILGSYFSTWDRVHPELEFSTHHPYVAARREQAAQSVAVGGGQASGGMDVCVIEIPYVFGSAPGLGNQWQLLFSTLKGLRGVLPVPDGGTSAISAAAAGDAIAAAAIAGEHDGRYPIKQVDLTWPQLMTHIAGALGIRARTFVVPASLLQLAIVPWGWSRAVRRVGIGLAPRRIVPDILARHVYVDDSRAALDYAGPAVDAGIADSAAA